MNADSPFRPEALLKKPLVRRRLGFGFPPITRKIVQWACVVGFAFVAYFFISSYIVQSVEVVGLSMFPTLHDTDHYFLNRLTYHFHPPKRNDIVVIRDPTDGTFVVKRIVGMPGESIRFKDGAVYVNGQKLVEPYVRGKLTFAQSSRDEMIICGTDQYFVLGDNRDNSFDSRMYGPVRRRNILGAVIR